jgi:hypothetical protein
MSLVSTHTYVACFSTNPVPAESYSNPSLTTSVLCNHHPFFHSADISLFIWVQVFSIISINLLTTESLRSWGSSVSIVSDYRLDEQATEVWSPAGAKDLSSYFCVQTGSGAHPTSCPIGTRAPFLGANRGWGVRLTTHPHLVPRSRTKYYEFKSK